MTKGHWERFLFTLIFATSFSVLGYFVPSIYKNYLDTTEYIEIRQPVPLEKEEYARGENTAFIINRKNLTNARAEISAELIHVNGEEQVLTLQGGDLVKEGVLNSTEGEYRVVIGRNYYVPCEALPGRNFFRVLLNYKIDGVEKGYTYITQVFTVTEDVDPRCKQ